MTECYNTKYAYQEKNECSSLIGIISLIKKIGLVICRAIQSTES